MVTSSPEPSQNRIPGEIGGVNKNKSYPLIKLIIVILIKLIIISLILIIRFYHPSKPQFLLQDATFFTFNISKTLLSSTLQITIVSKNPDDNSGIYYDDLGIYAEYKNQQITYQTDIPPVYQGHMETIVWSLLINGTNIPIAPYNVPFLTMDQSYGIINLTIKLHGRLHWKTVPFTTRKYHIHVLCDAIIDFRGNASDGAFLFSPLINLKYMLYRKCTVSV